MNPTVEELRADYDCEELRLYASHHQFYVQDSKPFGDTGDPTFWTQQSVEDHVATVEGVVGIGTGSYDFVRVFVKQYNEKPACDLQNWDHVTEASLFIAGGLLLVHGCLDDSGVYFGVKPGHYRVRCNHANLANAENPEDKDEADDWYFVQFWAAEKQPSIVLKRWSDNNPVTLT